MIRLAEPHGGILVDRVVPEDEAPRLRERAASLPPIALDDREVADLELMATGAASPLTGFMGLRDYQSVLGRMRLASGTPWPIPFTLAVTIEQMASVLREGAAALRDGLGRVRGIITATDAFVRSPRDEAQAMYGLDDPAHPGVRYLLSRPTGLLGGPIEVLPVPGGERPPRPATPREVRAMARRGAWQALTGLATAEGLGCLEAVGGTPPALLAAPPVALRHAPARDALLQAIVLKNHGAREISLEVDRSDWLSASWRIEGEELGMTSLCFVGRSTAAGPARRPGAAGPHPVMSVERPSPAAGAPA